MKKIIGVIVLIIIAVVLVFVLRTKDQPETAARLGVDHKNASYIIEGQEIRLINGKAETEAAPGSVSKITTEYFGNEAIGDLNGDGQPDVAFIITQDGGGTGTFAYIVVALKAQDGYRGTNAVILGDRIAPQTTEIRGGLLIVNYATRRSDEPMVAEPSIGKTLRLKVSGERLVEAL